MAEFSGNKDFFDLTNLRFEKVTDIQQSDGSIIGQVTMSYIGEIPDICPSCGKKLYKHSSREIKVIDAPFRTRKTELIISLPRRRCGTCKHLWMGSCPDIDAKRMVTSRAFADIAQRSMNMPFEQISNDYPIVGKTAKNIFVDFMEENKKKLRFKTPAFLGIDEIKIKGLGEITVVTDLEHRTLFDMFQGRNQKTLVEYFTDLPGTEDVLWVCSDMYRPFQNTLAATMPNAKWVIDHFHVVAKANEALDAIRRMIQSKMKSRLERIKTKRGLAYTLKTRSKDLTTEEAEKIRLLRKKPEMYPLAIAYDLKEDFFSIYDDNPESKDNAQKAFEEWEKNIPEDSLYDNFRDVAKMVHNHYDAIFARWDCPSAISNGYTECINRLIRENNLRGRGYSFDVLRGRTLYRNTNLRALSDNGLLYGPEVQESKPNFTYGSKLEEEDDESEEDDTFDNPEADSETEEVYNE